MPKELKLFRCIECNRTYYDFQGAFACETQHQQNGLWWEIFPSFSKKDKEIPQKHSVEHYTRHCIRCGTYLFTEQGINPQSCSPFTSPPESYLVKTSDTPFYSVGSLSGYGYHCESCYLTLVKSIRGIIKKHWPESSPNKNENGVKHGNQKKQ